MQAVNLPLSMALARMVFDVINDDIDQDRWYAVTSLVARGELAATFPTELRALVTGLPPIRPLTHLVPGHTGRVEVDLETPAPYQWRLEGRDLPMRAALCTLQGLRAPEGTAAR